MIILFELLLALLRHHSAAAPAGIQPWFSPHVPAVPRPPHEGDEKRVVTCPDPMMLWRHPALLGCARGRVPPVLMCQVRQCT